MPGRADAGILACDENRRCADRDEDVAGAVTAEKAGENALLSGAATGRMAAMPVVPTSNIKVKAIRVLFRRIIEAAFTDLFVLA